MAALPDDSALDTTPFDLLALPEPLLAAIASVLSDWSDRKALRASSRALRRAADRLFTSATLALRHVVSLPEQALRDGSSACQALQRLDRLTVCDGGDEIDTGEVRAAVQRFGAAGLSGLSALTSLRLAGFSAKGDELAEASCGAAMLRLLEWAPLGLSQLSIQVAGLDRATAWQHVPHSDAFCALQRVARLTGLTVLALPRALAVGGAFIADTGIAGPASAASSAGAAALPWPALCCLEASVDGPYLHLVGQLTSLTRLALRHSRGASADRLSAALAPLASLRELEFENVHGTEAGSELQLQGVVSRLTALQRLALVEGDHWPGVQLAPAAGAELFALRNIVDLSFDELECSSEQAAVLAALPQLAALKVLSLRLAAGHPPRFAALKRLRIACQAFAACFFDSDGFASLSVPAALDACLVCFPALLHCEAELSTGGFPPFAQLISAMCFTNEDTQCADVASLMSCPSLQRILLMGDRLAADVLPQGVVLSRASHLCLRMFLFQSCQWREYEWNGVMASLSSLPRLFPNLRRLDLSVRSLRPSSIRSDTEHLADALLKSLQQAPHLESLGLHHVPSAVLDRPAIERLAAGLVYLQQLSIGFESRKSAVASGVTADWMVQLECSLQPKRVQCELLPPSVVFNLW